MKVLKKIIDIVIAFFLTLLIIASFSVMVLSHTVLQKDYMLSQLEEIDYYEKVKTDLKNGFENYQYQSGLPENVFENLYSENALKSDINSFIDYLYDGGEIQNSSAEVKTRIEQNINQYLSENNITLKEEQKKNIENYENIIVQVYEKEVSSMANYIGQVPKVLEQLNKAVKMIEIGLLVTLVFLVLFDFLLHIKEMSEFVNCIGIAMIASGVLLFLLQMTIYKNIDINNILLLNQSFSDFTKYIIFDVLDKFKVYGMIFAVVGFVGIVWSNCWKKSK